MINNSKLLMGIAIIILNVGAKYIEVNFTKSQQSFLKSLSLGREILIFASIFTATRDILLSLIMTAVFLFLANTVFDENSSYCILPEKYTKIEEIIDINQDNFVSDEEIKRAEDILYKANIQKNKQMQVKVWENFNNRFI